MVGEKRELPGIQREQNPSKSPKLINIAFAFSHRKPSVSMKPLNASKELKRLCKEGSFKRFQKIFS